ncbi:MAG: thioredoxin family protein [Verrucomicrobia bacterium]|nr:thioredoxin family protein [Verrucomicrobiota bacterium]
MKRLPFLLAAAGLALLAGCSRSGVVDQTAATTAPNTAGAKSSVPARIAYGERVNLRDWLVPGKTTIFDFTSQGCPPCRAIAPRLHQLHAERSDVAVVEVDLNRPGVRGIDWHSPVAQQFGLESIPHFKIYGPDGKLRAEGDEAYGIVVGMIEGR